MAFTGNYSCNSFRTQLLTGFFSSGVSVASFKMALYTNAATLNQTTTTYTPDGEASGGSYIAGGQALTSTGIGSEPTSSGSIVFVNFLPVTWTGAITARGALIYSTTTGVAVCVLDFGNDKTSANTFTVTMPANTSTSALIRLV